MLKIKKSFHINILSVYLIKVLKANMIVDQAKYTRKDLFFRNNPDIFDMKSKGAGYNPTEDKQPHKG